MFDPCSRHKPVVNPGGIVDAFVGSRAPTTDQRHCVRSWAINNRSSSHHVAVRMALSRSKYLESSLKSGKESVRILESPLMRAPHKSRQRSLRQVRPILSRERGNSPSAPSYRKLRQVGRPSLAIHAPCGVRPAVTFKKRPVVSRFKGARCHEALPDPFRDGNGNGIADQSPAAAALSRVSQCASPSGRETLETFDGLDWRRSNAPTWQKNCWRRRNAEARAALERRHGVGSHPVTGASLRPVEANRACQIQSWPTLIWLVICEKNVTWIVSQTGDDVHAPTSLGEPESTTIDNPRGPTIAQSLKARRHVIHCRTPCQVQHEIHILDYDPRCGRRFEQPKKRIDNLCLRAFHSLLVACHRQILTRKPSRHDFSILGNRGKCAHVGVHNRIAESMPNDRLCIGVDFAHQQGAVA